MQRAYNLSCMCPGRAAWWDGSVNLEERWRSSPAFQDRVYAAATFAAGLALNLVGIVDVWIDPEIDR
jgi:hypothetical protein